MKELLDLLLLLLPLSLILIYLVRSAYTIGGKSLSRSPWQRQLCIAGVVLGLLAWLAASAMVLIAVIERGGFLIVPLFWFTAGASVIVQILGIATRANVGYLLAKAGAAQMVFCLLIWFFAARSV
jgi:hypothetical protein